MNKIKTATRVARTVAARAMMTMTKTLLLQTLSNQPNSRLLRRQAAGPLTCCGTVEQRVVLRPQRPT